MNLSLEALNTAGKTDFVNALAEVFGHSPWVAERSYAKRPFASLESLHSAMLEVVNEAEAEEQLSLIRARRDLAAEAELADEDAEPLQCEGTALDGLNEAELERLTLLNDAYKTKFNFPFILAVKGHTINSILLSLEERLRKGEAEEKQGALDEMAKIARFKLEALLGK